ncbi:MAG TPA: hypothetical protein VJ911_09875, partial [Cryomorphaceae bacterium]|nr:hypothetical protein [Cryomorphaceae bacterium]
MKFYSTTLACIIALSGFAQEKIVPATVHTNTKNHKARTATAPQMKSGELLTLPFIDDFSVDRFPENEDGYQVLWQGRQATRNNGWPIDAPTIGVVSFDGGDEFGYPYDWNDGRGPADTLISCPIDLDFESEDGLGLSFYYQPKGRAFFPPTALDSLILEFYAPDLDQWFWVWSTSDNSTTEEFSFQYIPIVQNKYLKEGFQFRFRNIAPLQGALGTWNVDYVWLDENETNINPINNDVAFARQEYSLLNELRAMPRDHFAQNPAQFMRETIEVALKNLNDGPRTLENNEIRIYHEGVLQNSFPNPNSPAIQAQSGLDYLHSVLSPPNEIVYNASLSEEELIFDVEIIHGVADFLATASNDTMRFQQTFFTEYAYDDGSAEAGYAVPGTGAEVALKYTNYQTDSIWAVKIYTMPIGLDHEGSTFTIRAWEDTGDGPGSVIAEAEQIVQFNLEGYQESVIYQFEEPVEVPSGSFFVGYGQSNQFEGVRVGLDFNTNGNPDNLYFRESAVWNGSQFQGTVMIRPMFTSTGYDSLVTGISHRDISDKIQLFPNPSAGFFRLQSADEEI